MPEPLPLKDVKPHVWYTYTDPDDSAVVYYIQVTSLTPRMEKLGFCVPVNKNKRVTKLVNTVPMLPYRTLGSSEELWAMLSEFDGTLRPVSLPEIYEELFRNSELAENITTRNTLLTKLIEGESRATPLRR